MAAIAIVKGSSWKMRPPYIPIMVPSFKRKESQKGSMLSKQQSTARKCALKLYFRPEILIGKNVPAYLLYGTCYQFNGLRTILGSIFGRVIVI